MGEAKSLSPWVVGWTMIFRELSGVGNLGADLSLLTVDQSYLDRLVSAAKRTLTIERFPALERTLVRTLQWTSSFVIKGSPSFVSVIFSVIK